MEKDNSNFTFTLGGAGTKRNFHGIEFDQPIIGENTIIYTDAKVFGPVIIAKNSKIKANVIVKEDIKESIK